MEESKKQLPMLEICNDDEDIIKDPYREWEKKHIPDKRGEIIEEAKRSDLNFCLGLRFILRVPDEDKDPSNAEIEELVRKALYKAVDAINNNVMYTIPFGRADSTREINVELTAKVLDITTVFDKPAIEEEEK